ncbi:MAG: FtsX-like permease family protein [Symploca sp. SIO3C6]|uniref:FtsX-like permease family protein n=1 Tax=Symploca sp. SIO1C4 TaxID=2607765 RepID=A0A6B3N6Y3_9CYAN|nr:FtsX-like permease family protein [Symploca sp. SIO3C6]NER27370.1 FtsX-like permease family protein [Symploca sp. SIO1C4]
MVSIARKNLLEDFPRFLVAQAGIMFAVTLVTMQTGIFNGFTRSSSQLIYNSNADIWVTSDRMVQLELTLPMPLSHLLLARQLPGVERAEALVFSGSLWRPPSGEISRVRVVGFEPNGQLFRPVNIVQGSLSALKKPYTVMVDTTNLNSLNVRGVGDVVEVGSLPAQLIGLTQGNRSIVSNAFMFTSLENANAYITSGQTTTISCKLPSGSEELTCTNTYFTNPVEDSQEEVSTTTEPPAIPKKLVASDLITYILIKAEPDQDLQELKGEIEAALPNTKTYTSEEFTAKNRIFWQRRTGIGFVLGLGAVVGVIVGVIIVAQILYSSVSDHLKEFGTLKAMGASDAQIYGVIVEQALWMAVLGYIPSTALCYGIATWTFATQGILILITPTSMLWVFGLTVFMCVGSAAFAIQKVTRLDPAMVFKA